MLPITEAITAGRTWLFVESSPFGVEATLPELIEYFGAPDSCETSGIDEQATTRTVSERLEMPCNGVVREMWS